MNDDLQAPNVFDMAARSWLSKPGKQSGEYIVERDDKASWTSTIEHYIYKGPDSIEEYEKGLLQFVKSPILDLGCGGGRFTVPLSRSGYSVVGIDISGGALEICRTMAGNERAKLAQMSINKLGFSEGAFSSILAVGFNIGIAGDLEGLTALFNYLNRLCKKGGYFLLTSFDVTKHKNFKPYRLRNIAAGRYVGQIRMRFRIGATIGDWFDWLYLASEDLSPLAEATGWRVVEIKHDAAQPAIYSAVLENMR